MVAAALDACPGLHLRRFLSRLSGNVPHDGRVLPLLGSALRAGEKAGREASDVGVLLRQRAGVLDLPLVPGGTALVRDFVRPWAGGRDGASARGGRASL